MDNDPKELAKMIQSGEYFKQSRAWYQTIYIGPISERTFFLLIAALAGLIVFFAFLSVSAFLPLTDRVSVLVPTEHMDEAVPHLRPLRGDGMTLREGLMRFYIANYVEKHESYTDTDYAGNYAFIRAQSDPAAFASYVAGYDVGNKQSPAAILGHVGQRKVTLQSVTINDSHEPYTATVKFSTDVLGYSQPLHADWTAVLQFKYNDLVVTPATDAKTHAETMQIKDPLFQVTNYALTQNQ